MKVAYRKLIASFFIGLASSVPALAQERAASESGPDLDGLSRNLGDSELSFQYAKSAAAAGDIKGAIAALERVLQINPNLPNIKLELGLLYLRAGQLDLARSYLEIAAAAPDAPDSARLRARQALAQIRSSSDPFNISGYASLGGSYQTNANGSPTAASVVRFGLTQVLTDLEIPRGGDFSITAAGGAELIVNTGGQRGNAIVMNIAAARNEYFKLDDLDATYINGRVGPIINLGPTLGPTGYIRPYATGTYLGLGGSTYFVGAGGGIEVSKRIGLATGVLVQAQYEYRNYYNSRRRSTSNDQTGDYWTLIGRVDQQLSPKTRLSFGAIGEKADTLRDFWSRKTVGAEAGVTQAFSLNGQRNRIIGRFNASYRRSSYDAPDRFVDLNRKRKENRYEIEAGLTVPVATGISVDVRALQTWNKANLPNYRYKNTLGSLGINFIF